MILRRSSSSFLSSERRFCSDSLALLDGEASSTERLVAVDLFDGLVLLRTLGDATTTVVVVVLRVVLVVVACVAIIAAAFLFPGVLGSSTGIVDSSRSTELSSSLSSCSSASSQF